MRVPLFIIATVLMLSCKSDLKYIDRDLLANGFPIILSTPDSVEIKTKDWGIQKDIVLIGEDASTYNLQIFSQNATTRSIQERINEEKEVVRNNPYFQRMTQADEDGFVFNLKIDSIESYDFRHIKVQGDREYLFRAGLYGTFDQGAIENMYRISREAK